jgi:hypothetical protein
MRFGHTSPVANGLLCRESNPSVRARELVLSAQLLPVGIVAEIPGDRLVAPARRIAQQPALIEFAPALIQPVR